MRRRSVPFRLSTFLRDARGAVAPTYAIAITALVGVAGVGFDYGRMVGMDSELQNAADQAALAGVTQLDGEAGACERAANAAREFVQNQSLMADGANAVTLQSEPECDASGMIRFWQDRDKTDAADSDENAKFLEVVVDPKGVTYALTPIIGAVGPDLAARAMAGIGSSVCKVPPIMICSPDASQPFDALGRRGHGLVATGHNPGANANQNGGVDNDDQSTHTTWAPGDFGFLQVEDPETTAQGRNAALLKALAYVNPPVDCTPIDDNRVSTGNPQGLYDAINTRFDIYDFNSNGNGNVLAPCQGGACPPAPNVVKDMTNANPNANNGCKLDRGTGGGGSGGGGRGGGQGGGGAGGQSGGWRLPAAGQEFRPLAGSGPLYDDNGTIQVMGLPRDLCHYTSFSGTGRCGGGNGRFGNGHWARGDYFRVNHTVSGVTQYPPDWTTITRYETYLWELANTLTSDGDQPGNPRGAPVCAAAGGPERRVLTVAVVTNCGDLRGQSVPVEVDEWVDVFLVEPSIDNATVRYNAFSDAVYMEVIGPSQVAGGDVYGSQEVRRDVPYLIQ